MLDDEHGRDPLIIGVDRFENGEVARHTIRVPR
jgi:hypothetical protein